jgi:hypothetical protein
VQKIGDGRYGYVRGENFHSAPFVAEQGNFASGRGQALVVPL